MTRFEEIFNVEMERACRMRHTADVFWTGYAAGLMRARFGNVAVDDKYHDAWLHDDSLGEQARGYREGFFKLVGPFVTTPQPKPEELPHDVERSSEAR